MYQTMSINELIHIRSQLQRNFQIAARSNNTRVKFFILNQMRVINAEIEVARCEGRN